MLFAPAFNSSSLPPGCVLDTPCHKFREIGPSDECWVLLCQDFLAGSCCFPQSSVSSLTEESPLAMEDLLGGVEFVKNSGGKKKKKKLNQQVVVVPASPSPSPSPAANANANASVSSKNRRRFAAAASLLSVYDVFRCKQLHIELSAVTAPKPINQQNHREILQAPAEAEEKSKPKSFQTVVADEQDPTQNQQQQKGDDQIQQRHRKSLEMWKRMEMVRRLQSDDAEQQELAAEEIRVAARRDADARTTLALMGAIPPLVAMLDSSTPASALVALLNLAVRNDQNKAAIVAAGAVPKILSLITNPQKQQQQHLQTQLLESSVAALLSLSALDSNKPAIASYPGAAEALVATINDSSKNSSDQARRDAIAALYNLSLCPANAPVLCGARAAPALLSAVYGPELRTRAVAAAANLVSTPAGRRAMARIDNAALVFVDVLSWGRCGCCPTSGTATSPCRGPSRNQIESALYVVMVLAQYSAAQRRAMCRAGCSSVLLELVLVGSPVAQERASRALQILAAGSDDGEFSRNSYCGLLVDDEDDEPSAGEDHIEMLEREIYSEERRAVNKLVQQSLKLNMQRITKRACIPEDFNASHNCRTDISGVT